MIWRLAPVFTIGSPPAPAADTGVASHAKRNVIVRTGNARAVGFPPRLSVAASHRARSARATLANARSSPVGRPNARLVQTWPAASWLRALPRARVAQRARAVLRIAGERATRAQPSIRPTCASRPHVSRPALSRASGRCTVRRHHRSHRVERHAPPPQSVRRPHGGRSASHPRTTSMARSSSVAKTAL